MKVRTSDVVWMLIVVWVLLSVSFLLAIAGLFHPGTFAHELARFVFGLN